MLNDPFLYLIHITVWAMQLIFIWGVLTYVFYDYFKQQHTLYNSKSWTYLKVKYSTIILIVDSKLIVELRAFVRVYLYYVLN